MVDTRSSNCRSSKRAANLGSWYSTRLSTSSRKRSSVNRPLVTKSRQHNLRKSVGPEKEIEPFSPSLKRKFVAVEKLISSSSVRSVRSKGTSRPTPTSYSQKSAEHRTPVSGRRKRRSLSRLSMESKKADTNMEEAVGLKLKKINARSFKSMFKKQRILKDVNAEPQGSNKVSNISNGEIGLKIVGNGDVNDECSARLLPCLRDYHSDKASDEVFQRRADNIKCRDISNGVIVDSSARRDAVDDPGSRCFGTDASVKEIDNDSCGLALCSSARNEPTVANTVKDIILSVTVSSASSARCDDYNYFGTCTICCKERRVSYDSPEQELCSCYPPVNNRPVGFCPCESHGVSQFDDNQNLCSMCNKDGELLRCSGRGCKRSYHCYCLDPLLANALPAVWHCSDCVKKKLLFGVRSVSNGVESIWDVREVELANTKGVRQRQYLVKYRGLAHVHNQWVPERHLLSEDISCLPEKSQIARWDKEWTMPQRLLKKRSVQEKIFIASRSDITVCNYEWLVKWHGLNYDDSTWELENEPFLSSSLCQELMKDYEDNYHGPIVSKCGQGQPAVKLSKIQPSHLQVNNNHLLKNVSKLHGCLLKGHNAVVLDDEDKVATIIFLIKSMEESSRPFLIVTASSSVSLWQAEFLRLVPSLDVVVYGGTKETGEGTIDRVTCQVLLSSTESVFEDFGNLKHHDWEALIIDDYPYSGMLGILSQVKALAADSMIILLRGEIKETTTEFLRILSLLESHAEFEKLKSLQFETNENLCQLKDRFSRFIAYGSTSSVSKFLEYWVPVHMSNYQLELYCETLLSNSTALCSSSRHDSIGALRDILAAARKCCDHPYLLKSSLQKKLIDEKQPGLEELLDIGIELSGKLQLLDKMLGEIKTRGLLALVLFQSIAGSQGIFIGDILDDFLRQRFGPNTYERVDACILLSKKQAAVNRFNQKESGKFVFLLETRACTSAIKLSALDVILIFNSDWNPANDLKVLQKMSIDATVEQIKVFRLYTTFTAEESALVLSKEDLNIDNNLQNRSRSAIDALLSWGSSHLFRKLDEYHHDSNSTSASEFSSEQSLALLNEVRKEFEAILSHSSQAIDSRSVISEVKLGVRSYTSTIQTAGEALFQSSDREEGHVFWKRLLDGKSPQWKHMKEEHSPRTRKRLHCLDRSFSDTNNDKDCTRKRKKVVDENVDPTFQVELGNQPMTPPVISSGVEAESSEQSQNFRKDRVDEDTPRYLSNLNSFAAKISEPEKTSLPDGPKDIHSLLQEELSRLCQTLNFSDDITCTVRTFLDYVIKNHDVSSDSLPILHALQISICWIAASITKQKVHKKDSLMCAKQHLNYQCTEEQANLVYSKMRSLKKKYLLCSESTSESGGDFLLSEGVSKSTSLNSGFKNLKVHLIEDCASEKLAGDHVLLQEKHELEYDVDETEANIEIDKPKKKIELKPQKHEEEIQELKQIWEAKRLKLVYDHKLEISCVRVMHGQGSLGIGKLKLLENSFANKMEEHNRLKNLQLKKLEAKQSAEMSRLIDCRGITGLEAANGPPEHCSRSAEDGEGLQLSTCSGVLESEDVCHLLWTPCSAQSPSKSFSALRNDVVVASSHSTAEVLDSDTHIRKATPDYSIGDLGTSDILNVGVNEHHNHLKSSSDTESIVSENIAAAPMQPDPDEFPAEAHHNEVMANANSAQSSKGSEAESEKECNSASPESLARQRDEPAKEVLGGLQSAEQTSHLELKVAVQDFCEQLSHQRDVDELPTEADVTAHTEVMDNANSVESRIESDTEPNNITASNEDLATVRDEPDEAANGGLHNDEQVVLHAEPTLLMQDCCESFSPASEGPSKGGNTFQTAEPARTEALPHEPFSLCNENLDVQHMQLDEQPACDASPAQNVESSSISESTVAVATQTVVSASERLNQTASPPVGSDGSHIYGPGGISVHQYNVPASLNYTPMSADPLQNELDRLNKEKAALEKNHEITMSTLTSDCEKEIAQIRDKYALKLQESEGEYRLKRDEHDKILMKIMMTKMLADAFRSKIAFRPAGNLLPGVSTGFTQQLNQSSSQGSGIPRPGAAVGAAVPRPQMTTDPSMQQQQHMLRPVSTSFVPSQTAAAAAVRPPIIGAISPASYHPRAGAEIRTRAPHLQPFRPSTPPVPQNAVTPPSVPHLRPPQMSSSLPVQKISQLPLNSVTSFASQPRTGGSIPGFQSQQVTSSQASRFLLPPVNFQQAMQHVSVSTGVNRSQLQGGAASTCNTSLSASGTNVLSDHRLSENLEMPGTKNDEVVCLSDDE